MKEYLIIKEHEEAHDLDYSKEDGTIMHPSKMTMEEKPKHEEVHGLDSYINMNGYHFTDELAETASKRMINANGMPHTWTVRQVAQAAMEFEHPKDWTITPGDLTYLANMAYSDFYPEVIKDERECIGYAMAVAKDPDGYEGMAFKRWLTDIKNKGTDIKWECFQ